MTKSGVFLINYGISDTRSLNHFHDVGMKSKSKQTPELFILSKPFLATYRF